MSNREMAAFKSLCFSAFGEWIKKIDDPNEESISEKTLLDLYVKNGLLSSESPYIKIYNAFVESLNATGDQLKKLIQ